MTLFEIKHRCTGSVIFSLECGSLKVCIEAAVSQEINLSEANLREANLSEANLREANLRLADLRLADLRGADLRGADLRLADLRGADLRGADLRGADLRLADLREANLSGADLRLADLRGADLRGADLTSVRDDFWAVLCASPGEAAGLRAALVAGRVNGSCYEGNCACLVGTLANVRGCKFDKIPGLVPNSSRPAEAFFLSIEFGDSPGNSQPAKLAVEWIDQWTANMQAAFGPAKEGQEVAV
jgi:hypothetical protein